jgi:hypothetical protein
MKIKPVIFLLLILPAYTLFGCASVPSNKVGNDPGREMIELRQSSSNKDAKIIQLQRLLAEKDQQLDEKDAKIKELSDKLEMFGVFER